MPNPFESGLRKVIPAVLVYPERGSQFLMLRRNAIQKCPAPDHHRGRWNGLGGKLELDESPLIAAQRELFEESGISLDLDAFKGLGTVYFPNFKAHKSEDWMVFIFIAQVLNGVEPSSTFGPEGELHWIEKSALTTLNLWPGDHYFLPMVTAHRPLMGTIWYQGSKVLRYSIQALE